MKERMELCGECAERLGRGYEVHRAAGDEDQKVVCENCGKRRYGGVYEVRIRRERRGE